MKFYSGTYFYTPIILIKMFGKKYQNQAELDKTRKL